MFSGFIHTAAGHDDMNMGVIIQAPVMSVQNRGHTNIGAQVFGIYAEVFQGAGNACNQKVVNERLVIPDQESDFIGERKGRHKVINR